MTLITIKESNELQCKIQELKNADSYQIVKNTLKSTPSILRKKLHIEYPNHVKDEDVDYLIKKFSEVEQDIILLIKELSCYKERHIQYAVHSKNIITSFKELFEKKDWEELFDLTSIKQTEVDPASNNKNTVLTSSADSTENLSEKHTGTIHSHHMNSLIIRKAINENKYINEKQSQGKLKEFNLEKYLQNGLIDIEEKLKPVCDFYDQKIIGNLEKLNMDVILHIRKSIKIREFMIDDYNRYKAKFERIETKELDSDLNILEEKNYKYLMRKLDNAILEYETTNCVIKRDLSFFLNNLLPTFIKTWFKQFYFTVFSIAHLLYQNIGNCQEINKFTRELMPFSKSFVNTKCLKSYPLIKNEYDDAIKVYKKLVKKESSLSKSLVNLVQI